MTEVRLPFEITRTHGTKHTIPVQVDLTPNVTHRINIPATGSITAKQARDLADILRYAAYVAETNDWMEI